MPTTSARLQRYRDARPRDLRILAVSHFLVSYPFANRLFAGSLDALDHCATIGSTAILSDGDVVFQPRKIRALGALRRSRRPRPPVHPQGARARRRGRQAAGRPLRARRRQGAHSRGGESGLGKPGHDRVAASGPLRARRRRRRPLSDARISRSSGSATSSSTISTGSSQRPRKRRTPTSRLNGRLVGEGQPGAAVKGSRRL